MARYIDADDFLDLFYVASMGQDKRFIQTVEQVIEDTPTADVVEVIRCKDCTEWDSKECECSHWYGFRENDFCSYGERRETK